MNNMDKKLFVLLILGLTVHQHQVNSQLFTLFSFAWDTYAALDSIHDTYSKFTTPSTADLMDKAIELAENLDKWGTKLEQKMQESVDMLLTRIPLQVEMNADVTALNRLFVRLDSLYRDFRHYLKTPEDFSDRAIKDLVATFTTRHTGGVEDMITQLHAVIVPPLQLKKSLFLLLAMETREYGLDVCDTGSSPLQRLVELYNVGIEAEKRAYTMMGFGYTLNSYLENVTTVSDMKRAREKLLARAQIYVRVLKNTMFLAETRFRRCDPPRHERGVTFHEFEKFMQGFVIQEGIFERDGTCPSNCLDQTMSGIKTDLFLGCDGYGCEGGSGTCFGRLLNCEFLSENTEICEVHVPGSRRYHWYEGPTWHLYGDNSEGCPGILEKAHRLIVHAQQDRSTCDVCSCICAEDTTESKSNHFISLREQITDIKNNMVVTGVKFEMEGQIARIKVMQGKLEPGAGISRNSSVWLNHEFIEFDGKKSSELFYDGINRYEFWGKPEGGKWQKLEPDEDIAVLTVEEKRIYLDNIYVEPGYVVTGVRFRRLNDVSMKPIQLEVHATRFDGETGQLDPDSSVWLKPDYMPYATKRGARRVQIDQKDLKNPAKSGKTTLDTEPYKFIDIEWSSFEDDAAQTVVPFLDGLPLISDPPTALVAVGLFYKAQPGYGGFLTFILDGLDNSPYLSESMPTRV